MHLQTKAGRVFNVALIAFSQNILQNIHVLLRAKDTSKLCNREKRYFSNMAECLSK